MTVSLVHPEPGNCRRCKSRRDVYSCSRRTGGTYQTPARMYSSSVCAECAIDLLAHATPDHGALGWSVNTLRAIVVSIHSLTGSDEARAAVATYDAKVAEKQERIDAEAERMKPYRDRIAERAEIRDWLFAQQHVDGLDERTCRNLAYGVKNGKAGHERTGWIHTTTPWTWERTMRQQVIDFITDPVNDEYDAATRQALVEGISEGRHRPAHLYPAHQETR